MWRKCFSSEFKCGRLDSLKEEECINMKKTNYKKTLFPFILLIFLLFLSMGVGLSQTQLEVEKVPEIKLGEITVKIREFKSIPSSPKLLEVQVEVLNQSQQTVVPPNSIKVAVTLKEVKFPSTKSTSEFTSTPEEIMLNFPLPPKTGRWVTIGYTFHDEAPESITFEVQINPPEGEKKTVTQLLQGLFED
jgi:hypothetical protein